MVSIQAGSIGDLRSKMARGRETLAQPAVWRTADYLAQEILRQRTAYTRCILDDYCIDRSLGRVVKGLTNKPVRFVSEGLTRRNADLMHRGEIVPVREESSCSPMSMCSRV